jgi:hypothetical protein
MTDDSPRYSKRGQRIRFHCGERLRWEETPEGSRLLYAPAPLPSLADLRAATQKAIEAPLGCDPLSAQLSPGMKVTIAFDDISVPVPPFADPDPRQVIIELLVELLAEKGVTDVELVASTGLRRQMTPAELRRMLGAKLFDDFYPDRLFCHDAEDKEGNQYLGKTDENEVVELNRRAVTSDLLISVSIVFSSMDGGHKSIQTGLMTYRSARYHHNVECLMASSSFMDPARSAFHTTLRRMGEVTTRYLRVFTVEVTLNTRTLPSWLSFLEKREDQYTLLDSSRMQLTRVGSRLLPAGFTARLWSGLHSGYGVTSVQAGRIEEVHEASRQNLYRQQSVTVKGQCDVLIAGIPSVSPYAVNSIVNPVLVVNLAAGFLFNLNLGKPLVRRGGVLIVANPLRRQFDRKTHPSYVEFFDRVLAQARDPYLIQDCEEEFAANEEYLEAYRHACAFHPVHPFYAWYWAVNGMEYLSKIIVVGAEDAEVAARIGWETASSVREAVEMAKAGLHKTDPAVTVFHWPPIFLPRVG